MKRIALKNSQSWPKDTVLQHGRSFQLKQESEPRLISPTQYEKFTITFEAVDFRAIAAEILKNLKSGPNIVLDLCCGTGTLEQSLLSSKNIKFVGVDIRENFLEVARQKTSTGENSEFICTDILNFDSTLRFDIAILPSAYHHIPPQDRLLLLQKIHKLLKDDGILIIYEPLVPYYSNNFGYVIRNLEFNTLRGTYLQRRLGSEFGSFKGLSKAVPLGEGQKVHYAKLQEDLDKAGFKILTETRTWPDENTFKDPKAGYFLFTVVRTNNSTSLQGHLSL